MGGWRKAVREGRGWMPRDAMMITIIITIVASLSDPRERSGSHGDPQSMGKFKVEAKLAEK